MLTRRYEGCESKYLSPLTLFDTFPLQIPPTASFLYGYSFSGFLTIQQAIDEFIISQALPEEMSPVDLIPSMSIFPTTSFNTDNFQSMIAQVVGLFYMLAFLFPVARLLRELVMEKENGIRDAFYMMGMEW